MSVAAKCEEAWPDPRALWEELLWEVEFDLLVRQCATQRLIAGSWCAIEGGISVRVWYHAERGLAAVGRRLPATFEAVLHAARARAEPARIFLRTRVLPRCTATGVCLDLELLLDRS